MNKNGLNENGLTTMLMITAGLSKFYKAYLEATLKPVVSIDFNPLYMFNQSYSSLIHYRMHMHSEDKTVEINKNNVEIYA